MSKNNFQKNPDKANPDLQPSEDNPVNPKEEIIDKKNQEESPIQKYPEDQNTG